MKNWHTYLMEENSLIDERYFVYKGGPKPAPGAGESAERAGQKPGEKEKPATLDDVKKKLESAKGTMKKLREQYSEQIKKNPDKFKKAIAKFTALDKKIQIIDKKIQDIEKQKGEKKQDVINQVNTQVDDLIFQITGEMPAQTVSLSQAPEKAPKSGEKAPKPSERARESVDKLGGLKNKLGKLLDSVYDNTKEFQEVRGQMDKAIGEILTEMQIDLNHVQRTQYIDLPGGYRMSVQKWTVNQDKMPNAIIYKGKDLMCYRDYGVLRKGDLRNMDSASRTAQIVKCLDQFPKSFRVANGAFQITNQDNFVLMGIDFAKFSRQDKPWTARLASCRISYNPADKLVVIQPRGLTYKVVFNPGNTNKISFIKEGSSKPDVWDMQQWVEKPKDQKARLETEARQKAEKQKAAKEKKRAEEKKRLQEALLRADREQAQREIKEIKEIKEKVNKFVNPEFKKLVKAGDKPNSFTVQAEKNDKKGLSLINNTPIHKLLALDKSKTEVVMLTIKGAKGKPDRKAMYYPGQKTAYEVDSKGKQTNNRVKFYNGDTISLDFKKPEAKDYANLNRDKKVHSPERIEGFRAFKELKESVQKFEKLKGTLKDLNLKPLEKYKSASYDPKKILTGENWTRDKVAKLGYKKATEIVKMETSVIDKGIDKKGSKPNDG